MFRYFLQFLCAALSLLPISGQAKECEKKIIGIILPMPHQALDDIVCGFQEELAQLRSNQDYEIKVVNGQGDITLQMALIKSLIASRCDIFVPVGTQCTQMTLSCIKKGCIVALAANLPKNVQKNTNFPPVTGVLDELSAKDELQFLCALFPKLKKFTIVHSGSEKIYDELKEIEVFTKASGIEVQLLMAQTMTDLATCSQSIAKDSECIFVMKDHLIVSGISLLVKQATLSMIPLITSDEGSVKAGASLALGVTEREIGKDGAKLTSTILNGESARDIPITSVKDVHIFMNLDACSKQGLHRDQVHEVANKLRYVITPYQHNSEG